MVYKCNVIVISDDDNLPGKTCLCNIIINKTFDNDNYYMLNTKKFEFKCIRSGEEYNIYFWDTLRDRFRIGNLLLLKIFSPCLIIYVFNLALNSYENFNEYTSRISEDFIDKLIEKSNNNSIIYLVGTKLDLNDNSSILNDIERKANTLIEQKKVKKYFKVSSRTGQGIEKLIDNIITEIRELLYEEVKEDNYKSRFNKYINY